MSETTLGSNPKRIIDVLSAMIERLGGRTKLYKARAALRKQRQTLEVKKNSPASTATSAEQISVLTLLIEQQGRTATLSAARNALRAAQPKRPRVKFSLVESEGVLQLVATNTGGVQVTPIDVMGQDLLSMVELRVLLNAGEQTVTPLPTFYDSVVFWRVWKKKNGGDPRMKVVARGDASPRPFIEPTTNWLMTGQILAIDLINSGGNMRQNSTLVVELGERKLLVTAIQIAAAGSTVVHIDADKLVAEGETLEDLPPLTIKITGMSDIELPIPSRILPAEVAAPVEEVAAEPEAEQPPWVFSEAYWTADGLSIDITNAGPVVPNHGHVYIDTLPFTDANVQFEVGAKQTVVISGRAADSLKASDTLRVWINNRLVHTFFVPAQELPALPEQPAEQVESGYPLTVTQHWDGNKLVVTLTRTEGVLGENLYAYIEAEERMLTTGEEISLPTVGDTKELIVPNAKVGAIMNLWLDGDVAFSGLVVIDKPSAPQAENLPQNSPTLTGETAYM